MKSPLLLLASLVALVSLSGEASANGNYGVRAQVVNPYIPSANVVVQPYAVQQVVAPVYSAPVQAVQTCPVQVQQVQVQQVQQVQAYTQAAVVAPVYSAAVVAPVYSAAVVSGYSSRLQVRVVHPPRKNLVQRILNR